MADWLELPSDLLEIVAQMSCDGVPVLMASAQISAFRSVCRTWRHVVAPSPRLLLPREEPEHALVFPLSRGWSVVVDARDTSCRLSHLATGATAALPKLTAVCDGTVITHIAYEHYTDDESVRGSGWRPGDKIRAGSGNRLVLRTYLGFTDLLRFAVHVPETGTDGIMIMMYHMMQGSTGMVFCRPGDAAWTKVEKPGRIGLGYFDFAYHDGKMFGLDTNGEMAVFDATTLAVLHLVKAPPETPHLANKMYGLCTDRMYRFGADKQQELNYVHLVTLPNKLVLVRASVRSSQPVAFGVFELGSAASDGLAWRKVNDAGNYQLFLDGYHATFRENGANNGTVIYYVHDENCVSTTAAYCYIMQGNKLECVYRSPDDGPEFSTKPSWFVPGTWSL